LSIYLLVPAPFSAISGGYIYDRRMVEGLRALPWPKFPLMRAL
jgi:hypothetical protein